MTDLFGNYKSQSTRTLESIDSSKFPDTNKDFEANIRRLNQFVDYLAQYITQMQKGIDAANQDVFQQTRSILSNFVVLLGGGSITDIDFGDLEFFLPALGALFGFDEDTPFPINLFNAAERFLLGYIVPLDSFGFVIEDLVLNLLEQFGIDTEGLEAIEELLSAFSGITVTISDFINIVFSLLGIFGVEDTSGLGPFADLWHALSQLLGGFSLETIGDLVDPVLDALAPWIKTVAQFIKWLDDIIKAFSGGLTDVNGVLNFASIFNVIDFTNPFDITTTIGDIIVNVFDPAGLLFSLPMMLNPPQSGFPKVFPYTFGEVNANPLQLFVQNLSRLLTGQFDGGDLSSQLFTLPQLVVNLIKNILLPQGLIAELVDGVLPDEQKPNIVQNIIDFAVDVISGGILGQTSGNSVSEFFNTILDLFNIGQNANSVNTQQNALIDEILSGGGGIIETFDGPEMTTLTNFSQRRLSGVAGTSGRKNGSAHWDPSGSADSIMINTHNTALQSNNQKASLIINSNIGPNSNPSRLGIQLRCNDAQDTYIEGRIERNTCEIGYVINDVYTRLGSQSGHSGAAGTWELVAGTSDDERQFLLYRNGQLLVDETDSADASAMGANNLKTGFIQKAGTNFFWIFVQVSVPDCDTFTAADRMV